VLVLIGALTAGAATPGTASVVSDLLVPGGVAGLFRAADMPGASDPTTALLAFVRVAHVLRAKPPFQALAYLDAVALAQSAAAALPPHGVALTPSGTVAEVVHTWASSSGLVVVGGSLQAAPGPDAAGRRQALEWAGVPLADWIKRLNAGETVRVEIPSERVPLPLSPEIWASAIVHRPVPPEQLAAAILGDRRAAFMYHGLMALDDETLAFFGNHPSLLSAVADKSAAVFAEWGRSIRLRNEHLVVPGGDNAAPVWQALIGREPTDVDGFIRDLLARDGGRAAFFYDTVAHLETPRQAFALGTGADADQINRARALYGSFARSRSVESLNGWQVVRHPVNPAAVLIQIRVDDTGRMAGPSWRSLWETVFGGLPQACASARVNAAPIDAAWLVDRIERERPERRAEWLGAVTFAQRMFPTAGLADLPAVCEAVTSFPRNNGLLLTLERIGLDRPADYATALRFASRSWAGFDRGAAVVDTAQVQGVLAILERAVTTGVLEKSRAHASAMSLFALPSRGPAGASASDPATGGLAVGAVGRWMRSTLLPQLCSDKTPAEACLVRAVSGQGLPAAPAIVLSWEDQRYRVDLGAATAVRLERIRVIQKSTRIDDALTLQDVAVALADPRAGADEIQRQVATLNALAPGLRLEFDGLFGHPIPALRATLDDARQSLAHADARTRGEKATRLLTMSDVLLADALVSFAYAGAIGDPDDSILMGGDPSRRHLFDATAGPALDAWHLPEEVRMPDKSWVIQGSVLALRTVYSQSWVRRLSVQDPGTRPRPDPQDVRAFGETVTAFSPFRLSDATRDGIVAAIRRGRTRAAELLTTPPALWQRAVSVGLSEWRCRAALWLVRTDQVRAVTLFSLTDLLRIGEPDLPRAELDGWGVATRTLDGSLSVRLPDGHAWEDVQGPRGAGVLPTQLADVHLRVAEALAALGLPAALSPDVAAYAVWDAITSADMAHPDDWWAVARAAAALPDDRFLDYVSALTAIGPLVPVANGAAIRLP
jgi:hypothetical protein